MARTVGDRSLTDKAKALIDSDMVLIAKAGDRNAHLWLAVSGHAAFGKLHSPSGIHILLSYFGQLIGPDFFGRLARFDCIPFVLRIALLGGCNEGRIDDLAAHC
jgi:hypothetical protein